VRLLRDPIVLITGLVVVVGVLVALVWSANTPDPTPQDGLQVGSDRVDDRADDPDRIDTDTDTDADQADGLGGDVVQFDDVTDLSSVTGRRVVVDRALVQGVPADEGFWISAGDGDRVWVLLTTAGESPFTVRPDQRVSFTGEAVAHDADFVQRPEFAEADAEALVNAGAHLEVSVGDIAIID
jgi:hypothetical protein